MKRAMTRKRHRPEEIVAKLRETDEALEREWRLVALTTHVGQMASTVARLSMLFIALSEYYLRNGNASKHPGANS